jgi:hypothetical protein
MRLRGSAAIWQICSHPQRSSEPICLQPNLNGVPPNCKFEIDDCASEWTFQVDSFDFIHVRGLYGCIRDWPEFYREEYKYVYPSYEARFIIPELSQTSQTWWVV